MLSDVTVLHDVCGADGRTNTIAYVAPRQVASTPEGINRPPQSERDLFDGHVVFFPGDIQDFSEKMRKHHSCSNFIEWCYEVTLKLLSRKYPRGHIWLVQPSKKAYNTICIYKNFVNSESVLGVPSHTTNFNGFNHFEALLKSAISRAALDSLEEAPLVLVGFSKGCIVLNQFLYEISKLGRNSEGDCVDSVGETFAKPSADFLGRVRSIVWLDGGHSGEEDVWVTDPNVILSLPQIQQCLPMKFHIHVTPYQVRDQHRLWKRVAEEEFIRLLREAKLDVEDTLHFEDEEPTIDSHFKILLDF